MHREVHPNTLRLIGGAVVLFAILAGFWARQDRLRMALVAATLQTNPDEVRRVLQDGADPNARGQYGETPLMVAASLRDARSVQFLLDAGADVHAADAVTGTTPLLHATLNASTDPVAGLETIRLLLQRGADPRVETDTGLSPYEIALRWQARVSKNPAYFRPERLSSQPSAAAAAELAMHALVHELLARGAQR